MTDLVVRRLLIDLETPFERHWLDDDPFGSALFGALSMSFPIGEQFFIDSVRAGLKDLPADKQAAFAAEAKGFIGQEATHRRLHGLFNAHLAQLGLVNRWEPRAARRLKFVEGLESRHQVAITAANEHFTALLADWLLTHPTLFAKTEPRLRMLWQWHAAEEAEHKSTAFDLYLALGGTHEWRIRWFRRTTFFFLTDALRQTVNNLHRDGQLWRWRTWRSAGRWLFGEHGIVSTTYAAWRQYFRPDFHPSQVSGDPSRRWLTENAQAYSIVGG